LENFEKKSQSIYEKCSNFKEKLKGYNQFFGFSFLKLTDSKINWIESFKKEFTTKGYFFLNKLIVIFIYYLLIKQLL
jgi:hypothetical protein